MPPALVSTTSSDVIRNNLNAIQTARGNFIKAESSEKIRRTLSHNVRIFDEEIYEPGEKVFYQRKKSKNWKTICDKQIHKLVVDSHFE